MLLCSIYGQFVVSACASTATAAEVLPSENVIAVVAEPGLPDQIDGDLACTDPTFPLIRTSSRLSWDVPKYVPLPPLKVKLATELHVANVPLEGETVNGVVVTGAGRSDSLLDAVTETVAPLESTTAICEPLVHCPVAVTVKRPPLLVTTVGDTEKDPGWEIR